MAEVIIFPNTLSVQVIREVQPYTFGSFVADLGGYLNLLSLVLLLLFPIRFQPTKPRTFLALWLLRKWRTRHELNPGAETNVNTDSTSDADIVLQPIAGAGGVSSSSALTKSAAAAS
jgi:hypothetical protein